MTKTLRFKKLVHPGMQGRLVVAFLGAALASTVVQAAVLNRALTAIATKLPNDEQVLLVEWPTVLLNSVALTALLTTCVVIGVGMVVTNRVAGPALHLERFLDGVLSGERVEPCELRSGDELQELCDKINQVTATAREQKAEQDRERRDDAIAA